MELIKDEGVHRINIDGRWDLEDLYRFPRAYEQVYYALYSLYPHEDEFTRLRVRQAYLTFPWQGGYSAVNFYNHLKYTIPKNKRPTIRSIQYASPGWIELLVGALVITGLISHIVVRVCTTLEKCNATYNAIYRGLVERKLLRIEAEKQQLEFERSNSAYLSEANAQMAEVLSIDAQQLAAINANTGSELKTLKIMLSIFRRVKILAEYRTRGKADP